MFKRLSMFSASPVSYAIGRRIAFILLASCFSIGAFTSAVQAQNSNNGKYPKVKFGLALAGSFAQFTSADNLYKLATGAKSVESAKQDLLLQPAAGVFLSFRLNPFISIQPELLLAVAGNANQYTLKYQRGNDSTLHSLTELDYLQIPITVRFDLSKAKVHPFLRIGATPAFLLKGTQKTTLTSTTTGNSSGQKEQTTTETGSLGINKINSSFTSGVGLQLGRFFSIEARANLGFINLSDSPNTIYENARTQNIGLVLGIGF